MKSVDKSKDEFI